MTKVFLLAISASVIALVVFVVIFFSTSTGPELSAPVPLDNPDAEYRIEKSGKNYILRYQDVNTHRIIMIGTSKQDLEPYLQKRVRVDGSYPRSLISNQQCIAENCHRIFEEGSGAVVVDISRVEEAK